MGITRGPSGGFDATIDQSLHDTLIRELQEEVGISSRTARIKRLSLWESCYPTSTSSCTRSRVSQGPIIRGHYLVVFYQVGLDEACTNKPEHDDTTPSRQPQSQLPHLQLQTEEVDSAMWLSVTSFRLIVNKMKQQEDTSKRNDNEKKSSLPLVPIIRTSNNTASTNKNNQQESVSLDTLVGIYPQPKKNHYHTHDNDGTNDNTATTATRTSSKEQSQEWCGIAQGSLFALEGLLGQQQQQNSKECKEYENHWL